MSCTEIPNKNENENEIIQVSFARGSIYCHTQYFSRNRSSQTSEAFRCHGARKLPLVAHQPLLFSYNEQRLITSLYLTTTQNAREDDQSFLSKRKNQQRTSENQGHFDFWSKIAEHNKKSKIERFQRMSLESRPAQIKTNQK